MSLLFVGAMPWVQLFHEGRRTSWASVLSADWTPHGSGRCVAIRRTDRWRVVGTNEAMFTWLSEWYLEPAMRGAGETWSVEAFQPGDVSIDIDLDTGLRAAGGGIEIEMTEPFDRQLVRREQYPLDEIAPTASWVRVLCARAHVMCDGEPMIGEPAVGNDSQGPRSTAQINVAEVWTT